MTPVMTGTDKIDGACHGHGQIRWRLLLGVVIQMVVVQGEVFSGRISGSGLIFLGKFCFDVRQRGGRIELICIYFDEYTRNLTSVYPSLRPPLLRYL